MEKFKYILESHGITTKIENGILFAFDEWWLNGVADGKWVSTESWSISDVKIFLGY